MYFLGKDSTLYHTIDYINLNKILGKIPDVNQETYQCIFGQQIFLLFSRQMS